MTQLARDMISTMYPPDIRNALIAAGMRGDLMMIDQITDLLADAGEVRPRSDFSLFPPASNAELSR